VPTEVAIAHDYLNQRGGAERVALAMTRAFPGAPLYTALYEPETTFPQFANVPVKVTWLNRLPFARRRHRLLLPLFAPTFSALRVEADVVLCSSSGWAHGVRTSGRKIVYCYTPARWLYQTRRYLGDQASVSRVAATAGLAALAPALRAWDRAAATSAHRYLAVSTETARAVAAAYGLEAEVLMPPIDLDPTLPAREVPGVEPGFWLCVSRLLPYKNVDAVLDGVRRHGGRLVVVGSGPERSRLELHAGPQARFLGTVDDEQLRWCYANCKGLIAAAYEDFGLTPLEAAAFGKPTAALRAGGYLDTVVDGRTGCMFDAATGTEIAEALDRLEAMAVDRDVLVAQAERFSLGSFHARLREIVAEEAGAAGAAPGRGIPALKPGSGYSRT
jgi:glycosyltransferase involved in cell wall biosynthesis